MNEHMTKLISKEKVLYSFDVFDTLIARTTASPFGIFLITMKKLQTEEKYSDLPDFLKNNFAVIRKECEYYAQANQLTLHNKFDCTFDDIYRLIQQNYALSETQVSLIKNLEIESELNNLLPIKTNIEKVKKLISENQDVILISDMYYSEDIIRKFLIHQDKVFENIKIYTSADIGKRKSNGSLYRYIKKELDVQKQIHFGDNKFSDVLQAKWNNIDSIQYNIEALKPYEKMLLNKDPNNLYFELSSGVSRIIRQTAGRGKVFDFGASFTAPILFSYVDWILEQAQNRNIKNLYFISRDGCIPKLIADILIAKRKLNIKTHYFYSSRRASRFPDESNIDTYINWIFSEITKFLSVNLISSRFNISPEELKSFISCKNDTEILSSAKACKIKNELLQNQDFKKLIVEVNKQRRNLFIKYLKQEIDFSKEDFAFVDINGSGRTQDNLSHIIGGFCSFPVYTFYLHLQSDMNLSEKSIKIAYINTVNYISAATELLCRTNFGQTVSYKEVDGHIKPEFEYEINSNMEKWGYKDYLDAIAEYANLFESVKLKNNIKLNDINLYINYFNYMMKSLDKETADVLGSIPFGMYGDEKNIKECAPKYNLLNIFNNKTSFDFISLQRTDIILKTILKFLKRILRLKNYGYISRKYDLAYIKIFKHKINIRNLLWK